MCVSIGALGGIDIRVYRVGLAETQRHLATLYPNGRRTILVYSEQGCGILNRNLGALIFRIRFGVYYIRIIIRSP